MSDWRDALTRPVREQPFALGLIVLIAAAAIAGVLLVGHRSSSPHRAGTVTVAQPPAVIGNRPAAPSTPALSPVQLVAATRIARRFLASYLPVLYGRRPARTITDADAHLRAALQAAATPPRAPRNRRPGVTGLLIKPQDEGTVLGIATIADRVSAPYRIVFQLGDQQGAWQVTELANY